MTIREFIDYRGHWSKAAMALTAVAFLMATFVHDRLYCLLLVFISLIAFAISATLSSIKVCCPRCGGSMLRLVNFCGAIPQGKTPIRFCPYCGVSLDDLK